MENNTPENKVNDSMQPMPRYYSDRAIYSFSVLGGPLFGSILMAINLKNSPEKACSSCKVLMIV